MKITVPSLGQGLQEVILVSFTLAPGRIVEKGDEIALVESDKAVHSVEATVAGVVRKVFVRQGAKLCVGDAICEVENAGESPNSPSDQHAIAPASGAYALREATPYDLGDMFAIWSANQRSTTTGLTESECEPHRQYLKTVLSTLSPPFRLDVAVLDAKVVGWVSMLPCRNNPVIRQQVAEIGLYVSDPDAARNPAVLLMRHAISCARMSRMKFLMAFTSNRNARARALLEATSFRLLGSADGATLVWTYDLKVTGKPHAVDIASA